MEVSEDELILMIAKKSEEALGLLFSCYEKKIKFEAYNFAKKYRIPILDMDDFIQEMHINFMDVLALYNWKLCKFYSFWLTVMRREMHHLTQKNYSHANDSRMYLPLNTELDLVNYSSAVNEEQVFHDSDWEMARNKIKDKDNTLQCLILWAQGYSYDEIALMFDISKARVNYAIRSSIGKLRDVLGVKIDKKK